ncbi:T9SS type A sorting domain-containing protein [Hymenobacter chitinivorans]|uniref:Putative secreted protein (Por secretion system target) n=1 Tax=Hymenobacter chitinivorans DSM 11115 TaxID=1121954 RepID=A0A2M9BA80_9BACT|nr:T9SS type A sorting domain-containing protein [Hymenobacter chitinivorans]PJJ54852.1 putative secreted protein (Por secretion system target) [Hymenobacter chitinivorans DSM 11115]
MKTSTRLFLLLALLLAQFTAWAATVTITVSDFSYSPKEVTIRPGDVVVWEWESGSHPTASDNSAWPTFQMNPSNISKSITFNNSGTFSYHCTAHAFFDSGTSKWQGMVGSITVSPALGTEARLAAPTLNVYPNPSKGMVMVNLAQKAGETYKLRFSNIIGREVRQIALKPETATDGLAVNLSDLPAGVYFYSLLVNDKVVSTKRLVLQN